MGGKRQNGNFSENVHSRAGNVKTAFFLEKSNLFHEFSHRIPAKSAQHVQANECVIENSVNVQ